MERIAISRVDRTRRPTLAKVLYFLLTFLESGLAVFGIRAPFEQPAYRVVATLGPGIEIRSYGALVAAQTTSEGDDGAAFSRLFAYITGANAGDKTIAMTTPVEMQGKPGAVSFAEAKTGLTMRFFLPRAIAAHPPAPTDPKVTIVDVPPRTFAVIRFSGRLDPASIAREAAFLAAALRRAGRKAESAPYVMGYDPPFTIPFLRRNEVAVEVAGGA